MTAPWAVWLALGVLTALAPAALAQGASQTITVTNPATYAPSAVTIDVGDSVTWRWANGQFPPHSVTADPGQSEIFDSGNQLDGFVLTHTFTSPGQFRFYCTVHSAPGGTTQNGVVTVVDPPPTAALAPSAPTAPAGAPIGFDASASRDGQGPIVRYEWDLDGDGPFETDTGAIPTVSHVYPTTGAVTVRVRVSDSAGNTAEASLPLTVDTGGLGPPPVVTAPDTVAPRLVRFATLSVRRRTVLAIRVTEPAHAGRAARAGAAWQGLAVHAHAASSGALPGRRREPDRPRAAARRPLPLAGGPRRPAGKPPAAHPPFPAPVAGQDMTNPTPGDVMTTQAMPSQAQLEAILASLREVPYQAAETALATQLKAIDDWERQVRDQAALAAMAGVLRAQVQAAQRMLDVTRRESEQVAEAMQRAARAFGVPSAS